MSCAVIRTRTQNEPWFESLPILLPLTTTLSSIQLLTHARTITFQINSKQHSLNLLYCRSPISQPTQRILFTQLRQILLVQRWCNFQCFPQTQLWHSQPSPAFPSHLFPHHPTREHIQNPQRRIHLHHVYFSLSVQVLAGFSQTRNPLRVGNEREVEGPRDRGHDRRPGNRTGMSEVEN